MFVFFWLLMSMGVAYGAKISGRPPFVWFAAAVILSPLLGSVGLWLFNRYDW